MKFLFIALLTVPFLTFAAGGVDGGGGKSVVCRDDNGKIVTAELLDLYEGRVQYGHHFQSSNDPVLVQMESAIKVITKGRGQNFQKDILNMANFVNLRKTILPDGTGLRDITDSHHVILPKGCKVEQLANFTNQNQILIDGEIWNELDNTNKAALLVHESLYKWFRNFGATNSLRARKYVAYAFAGIESVDIKEELPVDAYMCHTYPNENGSSLPGSHFWAYNNEDGELIFQFDYLEGDLILTKTTVLIDNIAVADLNNVEDKTYWLTLESGFDIADNVGIVISFEQKEINGVVHSVKKIGYGNMPDVASKMFECGAP